MKITDITNSTIEEPAIAHVFYLWHSLDAKREENEMINKIRNRFGYPYPFAFMLPWNRELNDMMLNALNTSVDAKRDYRSPWGYGVSGYTFNPLRMRLMLQVDGGLKNDVNVSDNNNNGYKHNHNKNVHRYNCKKTRVK